MSWILGKAEELLTKVDHAAGKAFRPEDADSQDQGVIDNPFSVQYVNSSSFSHDTHQQFASVGTDYNLSTSASVPTHLSELPTAKYNQASSLTASKASNSVQSVSRSGTNKSKDEELFNFLNSTDRSESATKRSPSNSRPLLNRDSGRHSRQSSSSSTSSSKKGRLTDDSQPPTHLNNDDSDKIDYNTDQSNSENQDDLFGNHETSSGYHSNQEDGLADNNDRRQISSVVLENQLMKSEMSSLTQEITLTLKRYKEAQEESAKLQRKLDQQGQHFSKSEKVIQELRAKETDWKEALSAKDSQLAVLRVRLDDTDAQLQSRLKQLELLQADSTRLIHDQSSSADVHSRAYGTLETKLSEAETALERQQDAHQQQQRESVERQNKLESQLQSLAETHSTTQRKLNEEKAKYADLFIQLKTTRMQAESAKQELTEYKDKAMRILQSKDKLIAGLKESSGASGSDVAAGLSLAEMESLKQEAEVLREELQRLYVTIESLKTEMMEFETQAKEETDSLQDQICTLEEQLGMELRRREEIEQETARTKQELRYAQEEVVKQKASLQSRLSDREAEIERLRNQVMNKSLNGSSQSELEGRLHTLTESLIHKQTMLEALSTEKNSLLLQLERLEKLYREAESVAVRGANMTSIVMNDDDDLRQRLPVFLHASPQDGDVTRRVKLAANTIDKFSVRLGVFLRRYPIARVFVILYMFLLHFWVMVVLITYQAEVHSSDYLPHPPNK